MSDQVELQRRWRLLLGHYSQNAPSNTAPSDDAMTPGDTNEALEEDIEKSMAAEERNADDDAEDTGEAEDIQAHESTGQAHELSALDQQRDDCLDFLYQREYQKRASDRDEGQTEESKTKGSLHATAITPVGWLQKSRKIFPRATLEILQKQAIERYGLTSLLTDITVLRQTPPTLAVVQTLLSFKSQLNENVMDEVRRIIRHVCAALDQALSQKVNALFGFRRRRHVNGRGRGLNQVDWAQTIRRNLQHYQQAEEALIIQRLFHFQPQHKRITWDIFIVVDQSASMLPSLVHSVVMANIFNQVKALNTHFILFDTSVLDVTDQLNDPVETLLSVQLGGGTDIGQAMTYVAGQITRPGRSLLVLLSDFCEGADEHVLFSEVKKLADAGVTLLGLGALDEAAIPAYCEPTAHQLRECGMQIAAMTPEYLAQWVSQAVTR